MTINHDLTLENLIVVIRESQGFSDHDRITEQCLLENDLGITGDDGSKLLEAIEKQFGVSLVGTDGTIRDVFHLAKDEYLFHSEGFNLVAWIASWFGKDLDKVKPITVGQLFEAVLKAKNS
jgi:hypothetical protein